MVGEIRLGDNLPILRGLPDGSVDLVYTDPPFNTGTTQRRTRLKTTAAADGDRVGFGGRRYGTVAVGSLGFADLFDDYLAFLEPRLRELHRVLAPHGTLYLHLDQREVHYAKVLLDAIFGRDRFLNEIVWAYDYGGRSQRRWPAKHDTILVYVKDPARYVFDRDAVDRIPYMAPGLVGPEKAARGKLPTDVWWQTIVPTGGAERTGYPTQKPVAIVRRIVAASSRPGGVVLDCFAGSGTTGAACLALGRRFLLIDDNPQALRVMARRFAGVADIAWRGFDPGPGASDPADATYPLQPASDMLGSNPSDADGASARPEQPVPTAGPREDTMSSTSTQPDIDDVEVGAEIPEGYRDLLESKALAHVATIGPDGAPQNNPVWFGTQGDRIVFSQTTQRQKYRNLQRDPRIALSIVDPTNDYRYLEIRGVVERIDPDPDNAFINAMAKKYLDQDVYPFHQPGDERVVVVVRPEHTSQMG